MIDVFPTISIYCLNLSSNQCCHILSTQCLDVCACLVGSDLAHPPQQLSLMPHHPLSSSCSQATSASRLSAVYSAPPIHTLPPHHCTPCLTCLSAGNHADALKLLLTNAPVASKGKNEQAKDMALNLVLKVCWRNFKVWHVQHP